MSGDQHLMPQPMAQLIHMGALGIHPMVTVVGTVTLLKMAMWALAQTLVAAAPQIDCHLLHLKPALIDFRLYNFDN